MRRGASAAGSRPKKVKTFPRRGRFFRRPPGVVRFLPDPLVPAPLPRLGVLSPLPALPALLVLTGRAPRGVRVADTE